MLDSFNSRIFPIIIALLLVPMLISISLAEPSDSDIYDRILADWNHRQQYATRIHYKVEGTNTYMQGWYSIEFDEPGKLPEKDSSHKHVIDFSLDFENNWMRKEITSSSYAPDDNQYLETLEIHLFDGNDLRLHRPHVSTQRSLQPKAGVAFPIELFLRTEKQQKFVFEAEDYPVFLSHGILPVNRQVKPHNLRMRNLPDMFRVHGKSVIDGREMVILRTPASSRSKDSFRELWVDVLRSSAVTRWITYVNSKVRSQLEIEYKKSDVGWLANSWSFTRFENRRIMNAIELAVTDISLDPEFRIEDFQVHPTPGMIVQNEDTRETYQQAKENQSPISRADLTKQVMRDRLVSTESRHFRIILTCSVIMCVLIFGVVIYLRKKQ